MMSATTVCAAAFLVTSLLAEYDDDVLCVCVQVRRLGDGERDTERGPASPPPAKKPSLLKRAYDLTVGNPADSTVSTAPSTRQAPLYLLQNWR